MNSSESSQPVRDPQQINFITLNRFWQLKTSQPHRSQWTISSSMKCQPRSFYFVCYISFCISRYRFLQLFLQIFFFQIHLNPQPPTPWWLKSAKYGKSFSSIFPKMPYNFSFFFKNLLIKSSKSIFYVSEVNCYCAWIFKGSNYRLCGLLFRTYCKNSYFDTSISNSVSFTKSVPKDQRH